MTFDGLDGSSVSTSIARRRAANHRGARWLGPNADPADALAVPWGRDTMCWLSPPYSRVRPFLEKAAQEAQRGCTVVAIVPARTDTRW